VERALGQRRSGFAFKVVQADSRLRYKENTMPISQGERRLKEFGRGGSRMMHSSSKVLVTAIILAFMVIIAGCERPTTPPASGNVPDTLEKIRREKVLKVGYIIYPPAVIKDPKTGALGGHLVDTVEELAKIMDVKIQYHEAAWGTFVAGLQTGQFDLSIAPTFRTIPRALAVTFTRSLFYVGNSAIAKKGDNRFKDLKDLSRAGIAIAVTQGEAGHEYAKANLPKAKLTVLSTADQSLAFSEVSAGRADIALGDAWATRQYAEKRPEVVDVFGKNPFNLTSVGWAVRSGDTNFLVFLNTAIDFFEDTGKLREWEQKYKAPWYHKVVHFEPY